MYTVCCIQCKFIYGKQCFLSLSKPGVYSGNLEFTQETWSSLGNLEFIRETWSLIGNLEFTRKPGVYCETYLHGNLEFTRETWSLLGNLEFTREIWS